MTRRQQTPLQRRLYRIIFGTDTPAGKWFDILLIIAILVSVTAHTQQQALLTAFFILVPSILLSGFIFPIRNMPELIQWLTVFNPMRWFLQIMHGIAIRGVGLQALWPVLATALVLVGVIGQADHLDAGRPLLPEVPRAERDCNGATRRIRRDARIDRPRAVAGTC